MRFLTCDIAPRLWDYLGGTARAAGIKVLAVGGAEDHIHILISPPPTMSPAKAMQMLKANSSRWLRETFPKLCLFAWQEGYGAFSVGVSQVSTTINYIRSQAGHHRRTDSRAEFTAFLKKHGIELPRTRNNGLPSPAGTRSITARSRHLRAGLLAVVP